MLGVFSLPTFQCMELAVKEEEEQKISVRSRYLGDEGQKDLGEFIDALCKEIRTKEIRKIEVEEQK